MSSQNSDEIDFITGDGVDNFAGPSSGTGTPAAGAAADGDMDDAAEIEAMKARVAEMEAEAAKLRDMQADADREAGGTPGAAPPGPSEEEKEEVDGRSVYVGNVSRVSGSAIRGWWRWCRREEVGGCRERMAKEDESRMAGMEGQSTESPLLVHYCEALRAAGLRGRERRHFDPRSTVLRCFLCLMLISHSPGGLWRDARGDPATLSVVRHDQPCHYSVRQVHRPSKGVSS